MSIISTTKIAKPVPYTLLGEVPADLPSRS